MAAAIAATVVGLSEAGCRRHLQRRQAKIEQRVEGGSGEVNLNTSPQAIFARSAALKNNAEIDMGYLAWRKAVTPQVRAYARQMMGDHTDLNTALDSAASARGIPLPVESEDRRADMERLAGLSGLEFDIAYMQEMIDSHRLAADIYGMEAQAGVDPLLREYAAHAYPVLMAHLEGASRIMANLRTNAAGGAARAPGPP